MIRSAWPSIPTNRFLYVVDTQQDQVIVYDADTLKLLRRIGTGGKNHFLTTPGDFGAPQGVALDNDGNVYVTDTLNNRVEIFDADGNFISLFGKERRWPRILRPAQGHRRRWRWAHLGSRCRCRTGFRSSIVKASC